jgi:hypothetical protein
MNSDDQRGAVRVIHNAIDLEVMGREKVSQLPVVSDGRLEGIISLDHILKFCGRRRIATVKGNQRIVIINIPWHINE